VADDLVGEELVVVALDDGGGRGAGRWSTAAGRSTCGGELWIIAMEGRRGKSRSRVVHCGWQLDLAVSPATTYFYVSCGLGYSLATLALSFNFREFMYKRIITFYK
jgi:hypothetical protein